MATQTQPLAVSNVLLCEVLPELGYCRETKEIADSQTIVVGDLLEIDGATWKKYVGGTCTGIALENITTSGDTGLITVLVRGPALVRESGLGSSVDAGGIIELAALGIIVREEAEALTQEGL